MDAPYQRGAVSASAWLNASIRDTRTFVGFAILSRPPRTDEQGRSFSLKILKAGRVAVRSAAAQKVETSSPVEAPAITVEALPGELPETPSDDRPAERESKRAIVLSLMGRPDSATIADLMGATGWLAHTTRAVLSGLRKQGVVIVRDRDPAQQASVYRIETQSLPAVA